MRKRLALAGLIITILGIGGWFLFMSISSQAPAEAALGWLLLFPFITLGALLFGVIGLVITILGLVLKAKAKQY